MTITSSDSLGPYVDTGVAVAPTPRPNHEIEVHGAGETDSGSKNTVAVTTASHIPHRDPKSPR